jgi:hypothetical protein
MPARALLVVVAAAAVAWLGVSALGAHAESRLTALTFGSGAPPSAAVLRQARHLEDAAGRLNPAAGRLPLYDGVLALRAHRPGEAARTFAAVARRQPADLEAWALTARAARVAHDARLAREAGAHVRALAPPVPRSPR